MASIDKNIMIKYYMKLIELKNREIEIKEKEIIKIDESINIDKKEIETFNKIIKDILKMNIETEILDAIEKSPKPDGKKKRRSKRKSH